MSTTPALDEPRTGRSAGKLRIALTVDPELPVPPGLYGGVERIVDMLAKGLVSRGHAVTLFAHPGSVSPARHIPWPGRSSRSFSDTVRNSATLARAVLRGGFDLVHSNSRIAYLTPILPLPIPKLMTYHREISSRTVRLGRALSRGTLEFTSVSHNLSRPVAGDGHWSAVPNGVPLESYAFSPSTPPDAPLVFLGRIEEIKGPHLAISIARQVGARLILAGNIPDAHRAWFDREIRPHVDDDQVRYVGPVDDKAKSDLLGSARALLMPILWEEPFGMVMVEAMACGTPVIALNRGAVSEIIDEGLTGFVRDDEAGMIEAVGRLTEIQRRHCRRVVEQRYSADAIVDGYLDVYRDLMRRHGPPMRETA